MTYQISMKEKLLSQSKSILSSLIEEKKLSILIEKGIESEKLNLEDISIQVKTALDNNFHLYVYQHTFKIGEETVIIDIFGEGWNIWHCLSDDYAVKWDSDRGIDVFEDNYLDDLNIQNILEALDYPKSFVNLEHPVFLSFIDEYEKVEKEKYFKQLKDILPGLSEVKSVCLNLVTLSFTSGADLVVDREKLDDTILFFEPKISQ